MSGAERCVNIKCTQYGHIHEGMCDTWGGGKPDEGSTTAAEVIRRTAEGLNLDPELMVGTYIYGQPPQYRVGPSPELVAAENRHLRVERGGIKYPNGPVPGHRHEDTDPAVKALADRARQCIKDVGAIDREITELTERIETLKAQRQEQHHTHLRCEEAIRILRTADQTKQPTQEMKHP